MQERLEHTLIGSSSDCNLSLRIDSPSQPSRIRVRECLPETRPPSRRGILIALYSSQGINRSIDNKLRGRIAEKALSHVHNWLVWG